ncbi:MAG: TonB-dependent receptor, partial [Bacteroidetes bacterium]|nr:TonB-dependent receptor [Bacteroidota bacterium]
MAVLLAGHMVQAQQEPDTIALNSVVVTAPPRSDFAAGLKVQAIDSAVLDRFHGADLGTLLGHEGPLFIKNYGPGSLATSSFRGAGAGHTAVLWNGFNIGSPMNGQIDLSLVPVGIADHIGIMYGGSSALWGSGAVGGAVMLDNAPNFNGGLTADAGASFGSFSDMRQHAGFALGRQKWSTSLRLFNATARNDFAYQPLGEAGAPVQRQRNAGMVQHGLLAENFFRINNRQRIDLGFWYQHNDRHVPPTMLQGNSTARQIDGSTRATAEWQRTGERMNSYVRAAWFDEQLAWHGSETDSAANSRTGTLIAEAEVRIKLNDQRQRINAGINDTYAQALSDGYPDRREQNRTALFASYLLTDRKSRSTTALSLRQKLVAGEPVPFTWSLGSSYRVAKWLTAKANVARVYRLPTFNDLYWVPGGNPDLLPESGYSGEAGLAVKGKLAPHVEANAEATVFQRTMDNWIIWLPGGAYWSPENLMNVWSRGLEMRGGTGWRMRNTAVRLDLMTNYVVSTNQTAKTRNDASVGKQLIYVP